MRAGKRRSQGGQSMEMSAPSRGSVHEWGNTFSDMDGRTRTPYIVVKSQSENSVISWPAMRLLGVLAERHFAEAVAALEKHGECQELEGLEAELERICSEVAPP